MKIGNAVVCSGLALAMSFGVVACKSTSTSTTTVETSVTDENGNTETNTSTTTSTTDENGVTTTETTSSTTNDVDYGDAITYTNEYLGIQGTLPSTYQEFDYGEPIEGEDPILCAADDDANAVMIVYRDMSVEPAYSDEYEWADAYSDAVVAEMQNEGEDVSEANIYSDSTFAGAPCTIFSTVSTQADGSAMYRDYIFFLVNGDDGPQGLRFEFFCNSQEALEEVETCFVGME